MTETTGVIMYCIHCGAKLLRVAKFCAACGQPVQSNDSLMGPVQASKEPMNWVYRDLVIDLRSQEVTARLGTQVSRAGSRLEWWAQIRSYVLNRIQEWIGAGWELVADIGPDCLIIDEARKTDLLKGGDGIINQNTYLSVQGVRIQMRRIVTAEEIVEPSALPVISITPSNAADLTSFGMQTEYKYPVASVAYTQDSRHFVAGSGKSVWIWPLKGGLVPELDTQPRILEGHTLWIRKVACPKVGIVASGASDKTIRIWDASSGKLLHTLAGHKRGIQGLSASSDGQYLATGTSEKEIRIWRVADGSLMRVIQAQNSVGTSLAFSPDAQTLAAGVVGWGTHLAIWRIRDGVLLESIKASNYMQTLAYTPDGRKIAVSDGSQIHLFSLGDGVSKEYTVEGPGRGEFVFSLVFSPTGQILASGSQDGIICLWDVSSGVLLHILKGHHKTVAGLTFAPSGHILTSGSDDHTTRFWGLS